MQTSSSESFPFEVHSWKPAYAQAMLLIDAGHDVDLNHWNPVLHPLADSAVIHLCERISQLSPRQPDLYVEAQSITDWIQRELAGNPLLNTRILVGMTVGSLTIQMVASISPALPTRLVLIDPVPVTVARSRLDYLGMEYLSESIEVPTTVILSGTMKSPDSGTPPNSRELQEQDVRRFAIRREIIAGRSRNNILLERPDVVFDALHSALHRSSST